MNKNFTDTVFLFSCGAKGTNLRTDMYALDFKEIYKIAKLHAVWEPVFLSLAKLNEKYPDTIPKDTFDEMNAEFVMNCTLQYRRHGLIHDVFKRFNETNIKYCLLRGENVAKFYNTPITYASGNVDILADPQKLDLCLDIMKNLGFAVENKKNGHCCVSCTYSAIQTVRIYTQLYTAETAELLCNDEIKCEEDYINVTTEDKTAYNTLGFTDGFIFMFLHFLKNFIFKNMKIRQLNDLLVYVENNYKRIDWEKADAFLQKYGFDKLFDCIISIGKKFFDFPQNLFEVSDKVDDDLTECVFGDMFDNGESDCNEVAQREFYNMYLEKRYEKYQNRNGEPYKKKSVGLFPNRTFMSQDFKYVNKSVILLPVAWGHRIIKGVLGKNNTRTDTAEYEERLELMQRLGMI